MNLKTAKNLFAMLLLLMPFLVSAQEDYTKYEALYPGCVDDAGSTIYYPNKWPADLELPVFPGGDIELTRFVNQNIEYPVLMPMLLQWQLADTVRRKADADNCSYDPQVPFVLTILLLHKNQYALLKLPRITFC